MNSTAVLTEVDIVIRLCLGFLAGGIIGFERSNRRQVAGLRTHILIALGATSLMLLSIWLPQIYFSGRNGDPGRIAAQVVSGMGFLGAGAIIRLGNNIKGLTTAASLWLVAAIGMTIGAGMYLTAAVTEGLSLFVLVVLNHLERKIFPVVMNKILVIQYKRSSAPNPKVIQKILKEYGIKSHSTNMSQGDKEGKNNKIRFLVGISDAVDLSALVNELKASDDISRVEIKEKL